MLSLHAGVLVFTVMYDAASLNASLVHAGVLVFTVMYDAAGLNAGLVHAGVLVITAASHGNAEFACRSFGVHNNV
jgi:hypothetical protein